MARTKNRYNAIGKSSSLLNDSKGSYNVALYARLSEERENQPSESIENQLAIMKRFIKNKPELATYREFTDRDYTGTDFDRPAFQSMMEEIKAGRINCVIVKDLSRLGRNLLETSNLIEVYFPFMKVRFISVNDHFDTIEETNGNKEMEIYLKNLVNDVYAKDVSKRISVVKDQGQAQGKFMGTHAPYGYRVDCDSPLRKFAIDPPAAEVVKDMFEMIIGGYSLRDISMLLQKRGLAVPGEYAKTRNLYKKEDDEKIWRIGTISSILNNETYIGNMVSGKRRKRLCDGEALHTLDKDEWIIIKNAHEPIVSEEMFREVQNILNQRRIKSAFSNNRTEEIPMKENKYSKLLFCGQCGYRMSFGSELKKNRRRFFYYCSDNYRADKAKCKTTISEKELDKALAASITALYKAEIKTAKGTDIKTMYKKILNDEEHRYCLRRKKMLECQENIRNRQAREYEAYVSCRITKTEFLHNSEESDRAFQTVEHDIELLDKEFLTLKSGIKKRMRWTEFLSDGSKAENLSADLIRLLVKRIDIYSGHKIHVTYTFGEPGGKKHD